MKVRFLNEDCELVTSQYTNGRNGRTCLRLVGEDGCPMATCTVNLPDEELRVGYVFIKDWSENAGMACALRIAGAVEFTGREVRTGYATAYEAKVL